MKLKAALFLSATCLAWPAVAQTTEQATQPAATPTGAELPRTDAEGSSRASADGEILVTGSRIRQDPNKSALPLQIVTVQQLEENGISNPEQLISFLSVNGNGADNLASNADVTSGAQRGTNGLSAANLRGQGPAGTLVLLNGRRVAAHGLQGGAVDVNQIPFAAIERVEVLKDGASAIYGTDAVGGVINFITRKDYQGLGMNGFVDITQRGDAPIYRLSAIVGHGDIKEDGFNVMASVSKSWNGALQGAARDFVNGNQPNRGLTIDTRGTPIATAFPLNPSTTFFPTGTLLGGTSGATQLTNLFIPGTTTLANGGINVLDLPGGAGCDTMDGGLAYDEQLWNAPGARFACAWDTGRAAVLQQPIETLTYFGRGVLRVGGRHDISLEITGSEASSAKRFSNAQISGNTSNLQVAYPLNAITAATYNSIYDQIARVFPAVGAVGDRTVDNVGNYGKPIAYRWRCIECGPREYNTDTKTFRAALGFEGPLFGDWDYRAGASYARSSAQSTLGTGYYYRGTTTTNALDPSAPTAPGASAPGLVGLLNSGIINPFSVAQSDAAKAGLAAISAYGATLYGGKYEVKQFDGSVSGGLFPIFGREIKAAFGVDYRRETYSFNGAPASATGPVIFLAAFDAVNALTPKSRNVKAAFGEVLIPIGQPLEVTVAGRVDDYTGFGSTFNPKVSAKFTPTNWLLLRASYNTGFRVPGFNQIFNGVTDSPYSGSDLVDPIRCPTFTPNTTDPNCAFIRPDILTGGNLTIGPETSKQFSGGIVFTPSRLWAASVDFWSVAVDNTITNLTLTQLIQNASLFPERFIRDPSTNVITDLDNRVINAGARRTQALDFSARGGFEDVLGGQINLSFEGTYLLKKREKLTQNSAYGPSLIGVFTFAGDLGLKWKHTASVSYARPDYGITLTQVYRDGYRNGALPGIAAGTVTRPDYNRFVSEYIVYNLSFAYTGLRPDFRIVAGIRNLFDTKPPFAITYDGNTGAGGSWEPRVADPRLRSFTLGVETKF